MTRSASTSTSSPIIITTGTGLLVPATLAGTAAAAGVVVLTGSAPPAAAGVLAAAHIGLGPMAAGYGLWTRAMARGGAERLAPLGYTTPLLSTVLLLATGAPTTVQTLIGVGLILACSLGVLAHDQHHHATARPAPPARPSRGVATDGPRADRLPGGRGDLSDR